jgi:hypothetical protein
MQYLAFDIETAPEPDNVLERLFSFDESAVKNYCLLTAEFDPSDVKVGNMKDPAKIEAKIEAARLKFTMDKGAVSESIDTARSEAWQTFRDRAALSPLTGRVLAIGRWNPEMPSGCVDCIQDGTESVSENVLIENFLSLADAVLSDGGSLVGHNIIGFDLPFLLRRGLKFGIRPPKTIVNSLSQYRPTNLIDTMREWQFGNRYEGFVKLDQLAAFFGTRRKTGDGADFHKKFFGTPEERQEALAYCHNDVVMTAEVAAMMRLIVKPSNLAAAQSESQPEPPPESPQPTHNVAPTAAQQDDIY